MSVKPEEGMVFTSLEEAEAFYYEYAKQSGFTVRKGSVYEVSGVIKGRHFVCSKKGNKPFKKYDSSSVSGKGKNKVKPRKKYSFHTGCVAHIVYTSRDGLSYKVNKFVEGHNHYLVGQEDMHFLHSNRHLTRVQESQIYELSFVNLGHVKAFNVMRTKYGGFEKVGATVVECKNFKRDLNCYIGEYDVEIVVRRMLNKKYFLPDYSFDYTVDDEGKPTAMFWADGECKANYQAFGEIVSFDATFNTNKYKMIFVPFTGIDNHFRNVSFGAGLLSSETTESYMWLLEKFLKAFGCQPKVVVTDQDPAMKIAIENVFDKCRHRLCMWHIMKKVSDKVGHALCNDDEFKEVMCSIVWTDSIDPECSDAEWLKIMNDYDLTSNKWLYEMFEMRGMWIPMYFRDEWMSGLMRKTSRSESENHFFSQVTNSQMTLLEFFNHYESSLEIQRHTHQKNDHDSRYTFPDLWTGFSIEEQAARIYTRAMFNDVQDEIYCSTKNCFGMNTITGDNTAKVFIKDHAAIGPGLLEVDFTRIDGDITCTCSSKRFERYGLLCSHVFYVLMMFEVLEIPQKYIMKRWTKEAAPNKVKVAMPLSSDSNFANAHEVDKVLRDIMSSYEYIINRISPDLEALCSVRDQMKEMAKKVHEENRPIVPKNRRDRFAEILRANQPVDGSTKLPGGIKNKGRGSHKRIKSKNEQASSRAGKRSRKCLICGLPGHDRRTCKVA
ncbi:hypothetical protein SSX86_006318 [Deinandra increscens subsp. villosa]|uniref:SWIM-type domain-containing protein n=1 Tax=Deinandra increscens subsp. villosa TaxID=3103831 RepID=A0AAP0H5K0_9ASTR